MLALLASSPAMGQGRHRHTKAKTEQVDVKKDNKAAADENVAYSDTASVDGDADEDYGEESSAPGMYDDADAMARHNIAANTLSFRNYDNPFAWFVALFTAGFGGILLALFIIIIVFAVFFGPLVIIIMIIRYLIRRHNDRVALAEKAMEAGVKVPEEMKPMDKQGDEYMWRKGVKNAAIGFGMMVMFYFWDANGLVGIGGLVLCLGIGQMVIARTTSMGLKKDSDNGNDNGNGSADGSGSGNAGSTPTGTPGQN